MGKTMQQSPGIDMVQLNDDVPVTTARSGRHNIFVERKGYEDDDDEKVDDGAYCAHRLGAIGRPHAQRSVDAVSKQPSLKNPSTTRGQRSHHLHLHSLQLRHVSSLESRLHESAPKPPDETITEGKPDAAEGERRKERLAIPLESVRKHRYTCRRQGEETNLLGAIQGRGYHAGRSSGPRKGENKTAQDETATVTRNRHACGSILPQSVECLSEAGTAFYKWNGAGDRINSFPGAWGSPATLRSEELRASPK